MHTCINILNFFCCICSTYLTKQLPQIHPNLMKYVFYKYLIDYADNFCLLCSMLLPSYYAQNYAGIIGSSLLYIYITHIYVYSRCLPCVYILIILMTIWHDYINFDYRESKWAWHCHPQVIYIEVITPSKQIHSYITLNTRFILSYLPMRYTHKWKPLQRVGCLARQLTMLLACQCIYRLLYGELMLHTPTYIATCF